MFRPDIFDPITQIIPSQNFGSSSQWHHRVEFLEPADNRASHQTLAQFVRHVMPLHHQNVREGMEFIGYSPYFREKYFLRGYVTSLLRYFRLSAQYH